MTDGKFYYLTAEYDFFRDKTTYFRKVIYLGKLIMGRYLINSKILKYLKKTEQRNKFTISALSFSHLVTKRTHRQTMTKAKVT